MKKERERERDGQFIGMEQFLYLYDCGAGLRAGSCSVRELVGFHIPLPFVFDSFILCSGHSPGFRLPLVSQLRACLFARDGGGGAW